MKPRTLPVLILFLALWGTAAAGYRVELVIFAHEPPQTREMLLPLEGPTPAPTGVRLMDIPVDGFRKVALSASMAGIADKLRRSHGYRVLATQAWIQPALGPGRAEAVQVEGGAGELGGTVTLVARRFLHFSTDLLFTPAAADGIPRTYRIRSRRRMKLGEIHYLDHPQVGVLVTVRRSGPPPP